jgi:type I restriction enzyme M protein
MTDVAGKLWGFCHTLRHEGVDYGDYIEQVTYLLFLKMAEERDISLPEGCDWAGLRKGSGTDLLEHYAEALRTLGKQRGLLGDVFAGSQSRFVDPVSLKKLIKLIDEVEWTELGVDVKAAAFEGLLEKAASEGKKGAGQYFTPRLLIDAIVRCLQPDPRVHSEYTICDPACGTGGFLVAAYEWLIGETHGGGLDRATAKRLVRETYFGQDLVARARRLALMNLYLHGLEPHITLGDSIYDPPTRTRYDVILTNPPFGTRGANQAPDRADFTVETSNKQLNLVQHVLTLLKPGGRAAVVVPDSVLFTSQAADVLRILMEDCDVHTVLRCPRGTFMPYAGGNNTNVLFFTKGAPTERVWVYDARANVPKITKTKRPLTAAHFAEFEQCYGNDPNGRAPRVRSDSAEDRWRDFILTDVQQSNYKLESLKWLRDELADEAEEGAEPVELLTEAIGELQLAIADLAGMQEMLEAGAGVA